jgi:D-glycero-alpha-D-manno-heptose-7-phosphate kinase
MIITRTPLRISLGGGGTDIPSYYRKSGKGFLIAAAITKHIYIAVNHNFEDDILLKYSKVERVPDPGLVEHRLLRECLIATGVPKAVEVSSMADIPAGTGLGSSGAFTVGVLRALHAYRRRIVSNEHLAREACEIEIDRLGEPIGKQDQYIAAIGGLGAFEFRDDESVGVSPVPVGDDVRHRLEDDLLLFYTGVRRPASEVLAYQQVSDEPSSGSLETNLDAVRDLGYETYDALVDGDVARFGALLTEQWKLKFERSPTAIHRTVDEWIGAGVAAGALGGKLVGAGGGGFLLFYADDKARLRQAMADLELHEVRFGFDYMGSTTLVDS